MKPELKIIIAQVLSLLIVTVFAAACGKKNVKQPASAEPVQIVDSAFADSEGDLSAREGSLRDKVYFSDPGVLTVRFDFDRSELSKEMRETLQANAAVLKKRPEVEIQVAGHCDERGTTEYNLALAQRRANAVRDYYKNLGIKLARMSTISYGEERPVCAEPTEACWAQNRRAETLLKKR
jgi:peptidoglycan-associated lipoprotein